MNAEPLLAMAARLLAKHRMSAVLIGNGAAALQGSPVTTLSLDSMFRKSPAFLAKLKRIAAELGAMVLTPYYPVSGLFRVVRDRDGLQLDFMARVDGIRSFESLRARATPVTIGRATLLVASLDDIIRSKAAANRPQDRAVLPVLRKTRDEKKKTDA